jgi:hypothetical protein
MVSAVPNVSVHKKSSTLFRKSSREKNKKIARFGDIINQPATQSQRERLYSKL